MYQARETGLIHFSLAEEIKGAFSRQQMSCFDLSRIHQLT